MLQTPGELDEALCIYREEALSVYERLDMRARAVSLGEIADVLRLGELDDAARIHLTRWTAPCGATSATPMGIGVSPEMVVFRTFGVA